MITPIQAAIEMTAISMTTFFILVWSVLVAACLFMAWYAPNWTPLDVLR